MEDYLIALRSRDNTPATLLRMDKEHEGQMIDGFRNEMKEKIKGMKLFQLIILKHCQASLIFTSWVGWEQRSVGLKDPNNNEQRAPLTFLLEL